MIKLAEVNSRATEELIDDVDLLIKNTYSDLKANVPEAINKLKEDKFLKAMFNKFPDESIAVAGGYVVNYLIGLEYQSDIDIFIYEGCTIEVVIGIIELFKIMYPVHFIANCKGVISMTSDDGAIVEIILRMQNSKLSILKDFDISGCKFLYDGNDIYTTEDGLIAITYGCIIVNPELCCLTSTYSHRIKKYFDKGFSIMYPDYPYYDLIAGISWTIIEPLRLCIGCLIMSFNTIENIDCKTRRILYCFKIEDKEVNPSYYSIKNIVDRIKNKEYGQIRSVYSNTMQLNIPGKYYNAEPIRIDYRTGFVNGIPDYCRFCLPSF